MVPPEVLCETKGSETEASATEAGETEAHLVSSLFSGLDRVKENPKYRLIQTAEMTKMK